jgi:hypothetical protein
MFTSKRRDRSWLVVLASCLGVYLVLATGYQWFVKPSVAKNSEATVTKLTPQFTALKQPSDATAVRPPSAAATPVANPDNRRPQPAIPEEFLRTAPQQSTAPPPAPAEIPVRAQTSEQPEHAERPAQARRSKPVRERDSPTVAARRSGTGGTTYPSYSGDRPF